MIHEELRQFIKEHAADDINRLLLGASRYPDIDVPFAVEQIRARKQIKEKLPSWYLNDNLIFPAKIAAEQCSSKLTAAYKQRLVSEDVHVCDLTGGLGIDSYFFSRKVKQVTYIERFAVYCEAARHNFSALGAENIEVIEGDTTQLIASLPACDVFYMDPARRGEGNKRVFALSDCEPNLPELLPLLLRDADSDKTPSPFVIAKLSPMADIQLTLDLLPGTTGIHVLSVRNECKELLFIIERTIPKEAPLIHCVNFAADGQEESFCFTYPEERETKPCLTDTISTYLYEPNASLLKAGAFKCVATRYGLKKLHISSHLYTSDVLTDSFPGRTFEVESVLPFNGKLCKELSKEIPQANITIRNFPLSVDELRKRTKIAEGGSVYLFATTLADGAKVLVKCCKMLHAV